MIHPVANHEKELGNWSCDGELIDAKQITIRAHHQALKLFAIGINLDQVKKINEQQSTNIPSERITKCCFLFVVISCFLVFIFVCYRCLFS